MFPFGSPSSPFSLNQTIGSSYPADPDDVLRTKKGLSRLGFYSVPREYGMTPWTDDEMFGGLKNFQRGNGLEVDGIMKPGGPTQSLLERRLSGRKDERDLMPKTFAPLSGLGKGEKNREDDVLGLRRGLAGLGLMPGSEAISKNTLFDSPLEKAIKNLQEKFGLKEDGVIRPKGPTLEVFERLLGKNRNESPAKPHVFSTVATEKTSDGRTPAPNLLQLAQAVKESADDTDSGQKPVNPTEELEISQAVKEQGDAAKSEPSTTPLPKIKPPVANPRIREHDGYGSGSFGARRVRSDGSNYKHEGADLVVTPGETVISIVDGTVIGEFDPYEKRPDKKGKYKGVEFKTDDGHRVKIMYIDSKDMGLKRGQRVEAGKTPIGRAQDISKVFPKNKFGKMTPHVHIEIRKDGVLKDPTPMLVPSR